MVSVPSPLELMSDDVMACPIPCFGCVFLCQTLKIHLYGYMGGDSTKDLRIYDKKAKESTGIYLYTWVSAKVSFF